MVSTMLDRKVEEQNKIWQYMDDLSQREAEWDAAERETWDKNEIRLREVSKDIERLERHAKTEAIDYSKIVNTGTPDEGRGTPEAEVEARELQRTKDYGKAFTSYVRGGLERVSNEERTLLLQNEGPELRAQGIATTAAGGFLVPPGFRTVLSETMKAYGGLMNHANIITTSTGQPLQWPSNDDTGNVGSILTENTQVTNLDMTLGSRTINAYVYTSRLVLVSLQLIQDSAFDIENWLPKKLGQRLGRAVAAHLVAGTGTAQPTGILTNAIVGKQGANGQTVSIIYDDLVDLEHSVDPAYRDNAIYVMSDQMLKVLRKLKDTTGRPLWAPIPAPGFPATLNGWPYYIDNSMPVPGASNKTIIFGNLNLGYLVRQVLDMQMVRFGERYMDFLQVGLLGFMRLDAQLDDPSAIRVYQHSAV